MKTPMTVAIIILVSIAVYLALTHDYGRTKVDTRIVSDQEIMRKCVGLGHWSLMKCVELERTREAKDQAAMPARPSQKTLRELAFEKNPIKPNQVSLERGGTIYQQYCFSCHGQEGKGDGPMAEYFKKPVLDLTNQYVQKRSDGEIFWKITEGNVPMPVFGDFLIKEDIWDAINFIRTLSSKHK